jgi:hypothetical protein
MNLHGIASGVISAVNPMVPATIRQSIGYTVSDDFSQVPAYATVTTTGQIQALSGSDIQRLNGMNVQGVVEKAYLNGNVEGLVRVMGKGGDLLTIGSKTYLVSAVLERWSDWCCVALTMQDDA